MDGVSLGEETTPVPVIVPEDQTLGPPDKDTVWLAPLLGLTLVPGRDVELDNG